MAVLGILCAVSSGVNAQEFKEHISKEFQVQKAAATVLAIYDLEGSVNVVGYAGSAVEIEIEKVVTAKSEESLEQGKKEFKLELQQTGDSILVYIAEPWDTRPNIQHWEERHRRIEYNVALQFTVKVPFDMNLDVRTVNNGKISIQDVAGALRAHNVNGPVTIKNAKGTTDARTINGDVTINYLSVPAESSEYYTLNGILTVTYPQSLSADLQFKSMNGEFYTEFENMAPLPAQVTKDVEKRKDGTLYKLNVARQVRIGNGGRLFRFETMNGNIYIKKQS